MFTRNTALITAGAALAGAALVGVPTLVVAMTNDDDRPGPGRFMRAGDWEGRGFGMMRGFGGPGGGMMGGFGGPGGGMMGGFGGPGGGGMMRGPFGWTDREPAGELSDAQAGELAVAAEREKLARDLYTAFADATGNLRLRHLAVTESRHLLALQTMLDIYEVDDPTAGTGPGEFAETEVATDYEAMLQQGSGSEEASLEVARELEQEFVDTLDQAAADVEDDASDVARVYEHLADASERHLDLLGQ